MLIHIDFIMNAERANTYDYICFLYFQLQSFLIRHPLSKSTSSNNMIYLLPNLEILKYNLLELIQLSIFIM